jgi:predicted transcriptional regulator
LINEVLGYVKNLKAIDKYIFLRLLIQQEAFICGNRKQSVKALGFSESVVERALNGLVDAGLLEKKIDEKTIGKRGRPSFQYKNNILEILSLHFNKSIEVQTFLFNEKINILLSADPVVDSIYELKADTRLLLIVLLHNSDKFGFVQNLDNSSLLKITGMKQQALEGQIKKLLDSGYICSKVSGINGKYLFGRISSIYVLNLQHATFINCTKTWATFLYFKHPDSLLYKPGYKLLGKQRFINFSAPSTFEAEKLICLAQIMVTLNDDVTMTDLQRKADWESRSLYSEIMQLIDYEQFKQVALFFITKSNPDTFKKLLQFKLNQYASELLTDNVFEPNSDKKTVIQTISEEIFHSKLDTAITNNTLLNERLYTDKNKHFIVSLIYSLSLLIARDVSKILSAKNFSKDIEDINEVNKMTDQLLATQYRILPPISDDYRYLTIASDFEVPNEKRYFIYGDTIVKKSEVNHSLVAEDVLLQVNNEFTYKTFAYGTDRDLQIAKKLLPTIESRFLLAQPRLSDKQLYCFSLHQHPNIRYSTEDEQHWLLPPKKTNELGQ